MEAVWTFASSLLNTERIRSRLVFEDEVFVQDHVKPLN